MVWEVKIVIFRLSRFFLVVVGEMVKSFIPNFGAMAFLKLHTKEYSFPIPRIQFSI